MWNLLLSSGRRLGRSTPGEHSRRPQTAVMGRLLHEEGGIAPLLCGAMLVDHTCPASRSQHRGQPQGSWSAECCLALGSQGNVHPFLGPSSPCLYPARASSEKLRGFGRGREPEPGQPLFSDKCPSSVVIMLGPGFCSTRSSLNFSVHISDQRSAKSRFQFRERGFCISDKLPGSSAAAEPKHAEDTGNAIQNFQAGFGPQPTVESYSPTPTSVAQEAASISRLTGSLVSGLFLRPQPRLSLENSSGSWAGGQAQKLAWDWGCALRTRRLQPSAPQDTAQRPGQAREGLGSPCRAQEGLPPKACVSGVQPTLGPEEGPTVQVGSGGGGPYHPPGWPHAAPPSLPTRF
nr:uncharacterized protein LOC111753094 [Loxodonta africana]